MGKGLDTIIDAGLDTKSGDDSQAADFGGDLAGDEGMDLNDSDAAQKSHAEQFRGAVGNALHGGAEWAADNPPQANVNPYTYLGQMAIGQRESLGQAAYHGSAAVMEAAHAQHSGYADELNMMEITQAIEAGAEQAGPEPVEPLSDGEPVHDGETGVDLTDERFQGYESLEDVPLEIFDEIRGNESAMEDE